MSAEFQYDLFLSHSSKDKETVRLIAERLQKDGLRFWFDEWCICPGDSIPAKVEEGLEQSKLLILCMSANMFGSDWAQLESTTFRFRDPLNKHRRFIPLRLDQTAIKGSLAQFRYLDWSGNVRDQNYDLLLKACRNCEKWTDGELNTKKENASRAHVSRILSARRNEWNRLKLDFEAEAGKYHDVGMSLLYLDKKDALSNHKLPKTNYVISLWQYLDSTSAPGFQENLKTINANEFGIQNSKLNALAVIGGEQTNLFCKMAKRGGSMLPTQVSEIITSGVMETLSPYLDEGKPIFVNNTNPLSAWINLMLVVTTSSHPGRFKNGQLAVDPFAASLTIFDYLKIPE